MALIKHIMEMYGDKLEFDKYRIICYNKKHI